MGSSQKTPVLWKLFSGSGDRKGVEVVLNVDRRGQHGLGLQDLEDVQVPATHGRWKGERGFD